MYNSSSENPNRIFSEIQVGSEVYMKDKRDRKSQNSSLLKKNKVKEFTLTYLKTL